jgi:hypothetical protein
MGSFIFLIREACDLFNKIYTIDFIVQMTFII